MKPGAVKSALEWAWMALAAAALVAVLAFGFYEAWLDIQAKRALIEMGKRR